MSAVFCEKCFRQIEAFYYSAHVAKCQGPDPYVSLEVIQFVAKGCPQARALETASRDSSAAVSPPKLSMPAAPATILRRRALQ